ncbi:hypothetical protein GCM10027048_10010 [Hymenobacter coalescens]
MGHVLEETLEGLFHFDGKVFRTARLLLLRPGRLTRKFLEGHRVDFVPPIRLYVFVSFVFFLVLAWASGHDERRLADTARPLTGAIQQAVLDSLRASGRSPAVVNLDLSLGNMRLDENDSLELGEAHFAWRDIRSYPASLSPAQADSLLRAKGGTPTFWNRLLLRQAVRLPGTTVEQLEQRINKALSLTMFVFMPLFAVLLKLLYRRFRYLAHLIFSLHLHVFAFVLMLLIIGLTRLLPGGYAGLLWVMPLYVVVALREVYAQGWPKTVLKGALLLGGYTVVLLLGLLSVLAFSFATV